MSTSKQHSNIYWQLLRISINAKHGLMSIAEKHNLTVMQMYTLCLLEEDSSLPMNSLSHMINCDASNITGIVDRLFVQKYIKRDENPNDRRAKMITLTPKGLKLCEKIFQSLAIYEPASLKKLSDVQKLQLLALLHEIEPAQ